MAQTWGEWIEKAEHLKSLIMTIFINEVELEERASDNDEKR